MEGAAESNGRATIREVHTLLEQQRLETRGHLDNMEERIVRALHGSEDRIVAASDKRIGALEDRVGSIEHRLDVNERGAAISAARRDGALWLPRSAFFFIERHASTVIAIALALLAILGILLSIDLTSLAGSN